MADIVETVLNTGNFNTLVAAIQAAGLVEILKSPGPFTVFAPSDRAFGKLPDGTVDSLLNDIPELKKVLTYHLVSGKITAADVVNMNKTPTVQGADLIFDTSSGVKVNGAIVVTPDIAADNGVIHAIDMVLLPPQ